MKTKIDFIPPEDMRLIAASARGKYMDRYGSNLPFNAELLLESEFDMKIIPVPYLKQLGLECAFSRDGKTILVDKNAYDNPSMRNRLCFTFAHELAHKVLHEKYLSIVDNLDPNQIDWAEKQASMFAAEFLMPEHLVLGVIATEILERIEAIVDSQISIEACISFKLKEISEHFGVSQQAMQYRIQNIDPSKVLSGPYISRADISELERLSANSRGVMALEQRVLRA